MKVDQPIRRLGERCLLISVVWRPPSAAALPLINIPNLCYNGNIKPTDCVDSNCLLSKCSLAKRSCLGCQSVKLSCWLFPRSTSWSGGSERESSDPPRESPPTFCSKHFANCGMIWISCLGAQLSRHELPESLLSKCCLATRSCLGCQSLKLSCWLLLRSPVGSRESPHPPPSALKYCKLWDDFDFLSQFPVVKADQRVPTTWSHSTEDADTSASLKVVAPMERSDLLQVTLHGYQPPSRRGTTHGAAVSAVAAGPLWLVGDCREIFQDRAGGGGGQSLLPVYAQLRHSADIDSTAGCWHQARPAVYAASSGLQQEVVSSCSESPGTRRGQTEFLHPSWPQHLTR